MIIYSRNNKLILNVKTSVSTRCHALDVASVLSWLYTPNYGYALTLAMNNELEIAGFINELKKSFQQELAAGGVVFTKDFKKVLLIKRRGVWELPKGKRDANERAQQTAVREVQEETGLKEMEIITSYKTTQHVFRKYGNNFFKITQWYIMQASENQQLIPQAEENIELAHWFELSEALLMFPMFRLVYDMLSELKNSLSLYRQKAANNS